MDRSQVIDQLFSESHFGSQNSAFDRRQLRNRLLNMPAMEFCGVVCDSYGLKLPPARSPAAPRRQEPNTPADHWPPFQSSAPADEIGRLRHITETHATAHHEAVHACAVCYFGDSAAVNYVEANGGAGCCNYSATNLSLAAQRRITLAPVVALAPDYWLKAPGYSSDREQYIQLLRDSGNGGTGDYDVLGCIDSRNDEEAVNEMLDVCSPFIKKLAAAIVRNGRLMGDSVHAKWCNWLRENEWVRDRLPRR